MYDELKYAYLKSHPLFANTPEQKIKDVCSQVRIKTVYRGERLNYGEGNYSKILLLIKGKIKITACDSMDHEMIKELLTAPDIFGDLSLAGNPSADESAEALAANTILCIFNSVDFREFLSENPMIAINYAAIVNMKLKRLENRHSDLVFQDTKSRLIRFIKNWAISDGNRMGDRIIIHNYLTHSDIANVISTSRQSVNTLLNELRDAGMVFYDRKRIELSSAMVWE